MVQQTPSVRDRINDAELLDYIVGTHHGRGRPLWPVELNDDLPKDTDPDRDKPSEVTCRLADFDLKTAGVFRPELWRGSALTQVGPICSGGWFGVTGIGDWHTWKCS